MKLFLLIISLFLFHSVQAEVISFDKDINVVLIGKDDDNIAFDGLKTQGNVFLKIVNGEIEIFNKNKKFKTKEMFFKNQDAVYYISIIKKAPNRLIRFKSLKNTDTNKEYVAVGLFNSLGNLDPSLMIAGNSDEFLILANLKYNLSESTRFSLYNSIESKNNKTGIDLIIDF